MGIGTALLNPKNLELVRKSSWKLGRPQIIDLGMRYYDEHPEEVAQIQRNLEYMGLSADGRDLDETLRHITAHYYEKLFGLVKRYEAIWIARNRVELGDALEPILEARAQGKAVFIAESHFGGTYILPGVLMAHGIGASMVGRFPEPVGTMFLETIDALVERYNAARMTLLDVDNEDLDIPLELMTRLMRGGVVSNVFDEPNAFSKPIKLLGRTILGGSGADLLLRRFSDDKVAVVTPFLIRTSEETFKLETDHHSLDAGNLVESLYRSLEARVRAHQHQWYFIHELHEGSHLPTTTQF